MGYQYSSDPERESNQVSFFLPGFYVGEFFVEFGNFKFMFVLIGLVVGIDKYMKCRWHSYYILLVIHAIMILLHTVEDGISL